MPVLSDLQTDLPCCWTLFTWVRNVWVRSSSWSSNSSSGAFSPLTRSRTGAWIQKRNHADLEVRQLWTCKQWKCRLNAKHSREIKQRHNWAFFLRALATHDPHQLLNKGHWLFWLQACLKTQYSWMLWQSMTRFCVLLPKENCLLVVLGKWNKPESLNKGSTYLQASEKFMRRASSASEKKKFWY